MNTFERIKQIVRQIPSGYVCTYGQIAKIAGIRNARLVGFALHTNKDSLDVPCHRVVFKDGSLSEGYSLGGREEQKSKLLSEGVKFISEYKVDLGSCLFD